jgi:hypothetical protein
VDRSQLELRGAHDAENARRGGCLKCLRDGFVGVGLRRPGSCEGGVGAPTSDQCDCASATGVVGRIAQGKTPTSTNVAYPPTWHCRWNRPQRHAGISPA